MSTDLPPLLAAVRDDIAAASWRTRAQTILLTTGVLAFGAMLGVHYSFAVVYNAIPPGVAARVGALATLTQTYETAMHVGAVVAAGGLCGAVALGQLEGE